VPIWHVFLHILCFRNSQIKTNKSYQKLKEVFLTANKIFNNQQRQNTKKKLIMHNSHVNESIFSYFLLCNRLFFFLLYVFRYHSYQFPSCLLLKTFLDLHSTAKHVTIDFNSLSLLFFYTSIFHRSKHLLCLLTLKERLKKSKICASMSHHSIKQMAYIS
jgi:hypothetical protein